MGENIQLRMVHGRELGHVKADQGQLEQVIINLAVNARDAMKDGGLLTIRTSNVSVRDAKSLDPSLISPEDEQITSGEYVLVEIEDTGTGIPREIVKNIFEPFFSTKEVGSGTGLGLSTCYGIVKQTGGYIYVKTSEGQGTNFQLYFPSYRDAQAAPAPDAHEEAKPTDLTGKATILLVEDETPVRIFAARALRNKGYEVIEADNGDTAIAAFNEHQGALDLIITDVVMPGMNGPKMIQTLESTAPGRMKNVKIVFISGYAEDAFIDTFGPERAFNFLPKPFTLKQLAGKIKEVLDAPMGA
jgi:two-component system cell cycle sensor histidine kinase/response regulator CckA